MDLRRFFASQTWWGKLLCAFLGYLVAGPVGAFFGVFIGNFFDRGLAEHFTNPFWPYHAEQRHGVKKIFLEATFSILGHISKADGHVSLQEINMAKTLMQQMNLNHAQKAAAQHFFNEGKKEGFQLKPIITLLQKATFDRPSLTKLFIDTQYNAALLDGLTEKKIQIINSILNCMRCAPIHEQSQFNEQFYRKANAGEPRASTQGTHDSAYAVLQVQPTATKQEVKRAYRRLVSQNHPDKLMAQGLPTERIKLANEKTQIICKAYEQICASKGW